MQRPKFEEINTFEEFEKFYWYREELQSICKNLGLEYVGNKSELMKVLKAYFDGKMILHSPKTQLKKCEKQLAIDIKLLEFGFALRNEYKPFFAKQLGVKNFHYTADMAAALKKVRQNQDKNFTIKDLIDVYLGKSDYAKYDNSSCQWNKFLKDFCADEYNNKFADKLKTASVLWKKLRQTDLPKIYSRDFVKENEGDL